MKNTKNILIVIIALAAGIGAGYLIFGNNKNMPPAAESHDHSGEAVEISNDGAEIWTCSMHPQIQQEEPGQCPICGMDLIPLSKNSSNDPLVLEMTDEAVKLANIQTTTIGEEMGQSGKAISQRDMRLSGKIQADERLASSQVAHVPGRIEKLYVTFTGEKVNKGQKLAAVYSPELITAQRELIEALKLENVNAGLLEAARNKLRFWKISDAAIKSIEEKGKIQETFTIYAEESGIVTNRRVAVGDYVKKGEPLFDLMNLRKVWVLFDAYEEDLPNIKLGNKIEFTTPAVPNKIFKSRITFIDPVINPNTRVASVRTEINNSNGLLKPEMFVNGILKGKAISRTQLTVPKSAVLWTGKRSVVYVKLPDTTIPSYKFREIELGDGLGDSYQLISGLEAGEEVVTYGSFSIDAAAQLNNQVSMMNKNVMLKGADHSTHLPDYTESTPIEFKQQLAEVSDAYILLKDAFVATDAEQAAAAAKGVEEKLAAVKMGLLKGDAHMYWMEQFDAMQAHSKKISELTDIKEQRKQFDFFSQALIKSIKVFGVPDDTLYVEHCPMAFDNKGADWISREKEIRNPFFGDKMLTCGIVKDTIDKEFKNPPMEMAKAPKMSGHNH
ncbi:MAG TPA: efflux RND transporter periplasmic adaptor subunit [Bacteroidetes bacterium]|nr:efflux RND transporter periplasmic adaptor subunit [Bacteroidota bacterium]